MSALGYDSFGDGPPLVLLHSGGMASGEWRPYVKTLSARYRLIVPDLPGHGRSRLAPGERLTISGAAAAVLALLDELGIERASWLGSSMGGAVALWVTLTAPGRVAKLILFRSGYRSGPEVHAEVVRMAEPRTWELWRLDRWMSEQHMPQGDPDAWHDVTRRVAAALDPATTEHAHDLGDLATIRVPTLIVAGDRDPVVSVGQLVEMYQTMPNADLWIIPHATHFPGTESWRLQIFETEILRFLDRRSEGPEPQ